MGSFEDEFVVGIRGFVDILEYSEVGVLVGLRFDRVV